MFDFIANIYILLLCLFSAETTLQSRLQCLMGLMMSQKIKMVSKGCKGTSHLSTKCVVSLNISLHFTTNFNRQAVLESQIKHTSKSKIAFSLATSVEANLVCVKG